MGNRGCWAIIGTVAILLGLLGRFAFQWMAERFAGRGFNDTTVSILAADAVLSALLTGAGVLLVTRAFVVAGWPAWTDKRGREAQRNGSARRASAGSGGSDPEPATPQLVMSLRRKCQTAAEVTTTA